MYVFIPLFQLFYMLKGDMCLKVVEKGVHVDIPIKEGEVNLFILSIFPLRCLLLFLTIKYQYVGFF